MHVFISYAHDDLDFAQNAKHELERRRIPVWIDELTPAGDDWRQDIEEALRRAYAVVLILTPDAMDSQYVTYEWAFALGAEITVVPLLRKKTVVHPRIDRLQHLDFTSTKNRPWDELAERLTAIQEQRTPVSAGNLGESLRSRQGETRDAAIRLLRKMSDRAALPLVEQLLFPENHGVRYTSDVRKAAVDALGNMGETALRPLLRTLVHADKSIRYIAASKLAALGDAAVPDLLTLLDSPDIDARLRATWILGEIGSPAAADALARKLDDKDSQPTYRKRICDGAADALIAIGTPEALCQAAAYWEGQLASKRKHWSKDHDMRLSDYAAQRLLDINTPESRKALEKWRRDQDKEPA
ncbi:MAG: TIR domain-containing protein [Anaerolineae bacterium]|nr:TIR domain-containing protein [Anaerolineae bacterium]NUQ05242.1 HEAT repeat domain-containing protein [Anaerolineae bacterium]